MVFYVPLVTFFEPYKVESSEPGMKDQEEEEERREDAGIRCPQSQDILELNQAGCLVCIF